MIFSLSLQFKSVDTRKSIQRYGECVAKELKLQTLKHVFAFVPAHDIVITGCNIIMIILE